MFESFYFLPMFLALIGLFSQSHVKSFTHHAIMMADILTQIQNRLIKNDSADIRYLADISDIYLKNDWLFLINLLKFTPL